MKRLLIRAIPPILIVAAGLATFYAMKIAASKSKRRPAEERAPTVAVVKVFKADLPVVVNATGIVSPARQVEMIPEVAGRIVGLSKKAIPGGRFKKGEVIARIDPRDYELAIDQEQSRVRQAKLELELETGRGEIAEREWKLMKQNRDEPGNPLLLRTPQMETAKENLQAATSGLKRARLNLERTVLRAPFNAIVLAKYVDIGQLAGPSTRVVTLIGTDQLWINASVSVEQLSAIEIPGLNSDKGSQATVVHELQPTKRIERKGQVLKLQGQLDALNRTAKLLIGIDKPYDTNGQELPLLPGAYVKVSIHGRLLHDVYRVPRTAVFNDDSVWEVDQKNRLKRNTVKTVWRARDWVVISEGLVDGARVVTSPLSLPIPGMFVSAQLRSSQPTKDKRTQAKMAPDMQQSTLSNNGKNRGDKGPR
jgi:multidrug efflux system membrane fusion protein